VTNDKNIRGSTRLRAVLLDTTPGARISLERKNYVLGQREIEKT
jgi:hypothetical protein